MRYVDKFKGKIVKVFLRYDILSHTYKSIQSKTVLESLLISISIRCEHEPHFYKFNSPPEKIAGLESDQN